MKARMAHACMQPFLLQNGEEEWCAQEALHHPREDPKRGPKQTRTRMLAFNHNHPRGAEDRLRVRSALAKLYNLRAQCQSPPTHPPLLLVWLRRLLLFRHRQPPSNGWVRRIFLHLQNLCADFLECVAITLLEDLQLCRPVQVLRVVLYLLLEPTAWTCNLCLPCFWMWRCSAMQ